MADALKALLPLFAFMLIPLWIPLIAVVAGGILDVVKARRVRARVVEQHPRQHAAVKVRPVPEAT